MIVMGIDPSICRSGWALIGKGGKCVSGVVTSAKNPDDWRGDVLETERLRNVAEAILKVAKDAGAELAVIEGLAIGMQKTRSIMQLAGLNYLIRYLLSVNDIPFLVVTPTELKKFVTGDGRAKKDGMAKAARERWGVEAKDDNEVDAISLALYAIMLEESYEEE